MQRSDESCQCRTGEDLSRRVLMIKKLHPSVSMQVLLLSFCQFGTITGCKVFTHKSGRSAGCASVEFSCHKAACTALRAMQFASIHGKHVEIQWFGQGPQGLDGFHRHGSVHQLAPQGLPGLAAADVGNHQAMAYSTLPAGVVLLQPLQQQLAPPPHILRQMSDMDGSGGEPHPAAYDGYLISHIQAASIPTRLQPVPGQLQPPCYQGYAACGPMPGLQPEEHMLQQAPMYMHQQPEPGHLPHAMLQPVHLQHEQQRRRPAQTPPLPPPQPLMAPVHVPMAAPLPMSQPYLHVPQYLQQHQHHSEQQQREQQQQQQQQQHHNGAGVQLRSARPPSGSRHSNGQPAAVANRSAAPAGPAASNGGAIDHFVIPARQRRMSEHGMLRPGRAAPPGGKQPAATTKQPAAVAVEVHATSAASEQQGKGGAAASAVAILRQQSKLPELYLTPANGIEPERLDADSPPTASPSPAPRQHRRTSSAGEIAAGEIILDDFQMVPVVYSLTHTEATAAPTIFSVRTTLEDFEETELPGNDNVNENSNGIGNGDAAGSGSAPGVLDGEAAAAAVAAMGAARGDVKAAAAAVLAAPQDDVRPLQDSPRSRTPRDSTTIKRPYRHHTGWSGSLSAREEHTTDSHTFNIDSDTLNKQFAKLLASNTASPRYSRPETLEATSAIKARSNVRAAAAQVWQQLSPTKSLGALSLDEEEGAAGGTRRGVALRAAGSSIWGVAADAASLTSPVSSEASPKKLQELRRLWEV